MPCMSVCLQRLRLQPSLLGMLCGPIGGTHAHIHSCSWLAGFSDQHHILPATPARPSHIHFVVCRSAFLSIPLHTAASSITSHSYPHHIPKKQKMTYARQLEMYESAVMQKRLEEMTEAELQQLMSEVEADKARLAAAKEAMQRQQQQQRQ